MVNCLEKIRWGKVLIAGFIFLIITTIIRQIEVVFTMDYYKIPEYFGVWSKLMMPSAGPPPVSFLVTSLFFSLATGVVLAAFYDFVKNLLPKEKWPRIICFWEIVIGLSFVFFTLPTYLLFNLPLILLVWWFISSAVIFFLTAVVFANILK